MKNSFFILRKEQNRLFGLAYIPICTYVWHVMFLPFFRGVLLTLQNQLYLAGPDTPLTTPSYHLPLYYCFTLYTILLLPLQPSITLTLFTALQDYFPY